MGLVTGGESRNRGLVACRLPSGFRLEFFFLYCALSETHSVSARCGLDKKSDTVKWLIGGAQLRGIQALIQVSEVVHLGLISRGAGTWCALCLRELLAPFAGTCTGCSGADDQRPADN